MGRAEIFIGDLSFFCHENDIFQLFSQYGQVMEVRIKKSEGNGKSLMFGFVKMESLEAADEVIRQLNGIMFMGRLLKVQYSQGRNNMMDSEPQGFQVHVAFRSFYNLTELKVINEEVLRSIFQNYGEITDVVVKEYKVYRETNSQEGYAFVTFIHQQAADHLINELKFMNLDGVEYTFGVGSHSKVFVRKHHAPHQMSQNPFIQHAQARRMPLPTGNAPTSYLQQDLYYNNNNGGGMNRPGMQMMSAPHHLSGGNGVPSSLGSSIPSYGQAYQPYVIQPPMQVSPMNMQMYSPRSDGGSSGSSMSTLYSNGMYSQPAQFSHPSQTSLSLPTTNIVYYNPSMQPSPASAPTSNPNNFYYSAESYPGRSPLSRQSSDQSSSPPLNYLNK